MSVSKGNAGEHLIMAELLSRGFDAYWADRGNPAYDIACFWENYATRLRVKTTSNGSAVWSVKKNGDLFVDVQNESDHVVICNIENGVRGARIYIVPTRIVQAELIANHEHYLAHVGKSGKPRSAKTSIRGLRFYGDPSPDDLSRGYDKKFSQYEDAWDWLVSATWVSKMQSSFALPPDEAIPETRYQLMDGTVFVLRRWRDGSTARGHTTIDELQDMSLTPITEDGWYDIAARFLGDDPKWSF